MGWLDKLLGREAAESPGARPAAPKAVQPPPSPPSPEAQPELSEAEKAVDDLIEREKPKEAMARCEEELRKAPGHPGLLRLKAECCVELSLPQEALLAALDEVLAADAKDHSSRSQRAHILFKLGRREEALLGFESALKLKEKAWTWASKAEVLMALGRTADAEAAARRALELLPTETWVSQPIVFVILQRIPGLDARIIGEIPEHLKEQVLIIERQFKKKR